MSMLSKKPFSLLETRRRETQKKNAMDVCTKTKHVPILIIISTYLVFVLSREKNDSDVCFLTFLTL